MTEEISDVIFKLKNQEISDDENSNTSDKSSDYNDKYEVLKKNLDLLSKLDVNKLVESISNVLDFLKYRNDIQEVYELPALEDDEIDEICEMTEDEIKAEEKKRIVYVFMIKSKPNIKASIEDENEKQYEDEVKSTNLILFKLIFPMFEVIPQIKFYFMSKLFRVAHLMQDDDNIGEKIINMMKRKILTTLNNNYDLYISKYIITDGEYTYCEQTIDEMVKDYKKNSLGNLLSEFHESGLSASIKTGDFYKDMVLDKLENPTKTIREENLNIDDIYNLIKHMENQRPSIKIKDIDDINNIKTDDCCLIDIIFIILGLKDLREFNSFDKNFTQDYILRSIKASFYIISLLCREFINSSLIKII